MLAVGRLGFEFGLWHLVAFKLFQDLFLFNICRGGGKLFHWL